jgi:hypothetical protein
LVTIKFSNKIRKAVAEVKDFNFQATGPSISLLPIIIIIGVDFIMRKNVMVARCGQIFQHR